VWPDYTLLVRTDIFEKNNIPIPATWDELYTALKKLKEIYPDSIPFSDRFQFNSTLNIAATGFGTKAGWGFGNGLTYKADKDEFVYTSTTPEYKNMLTYFNKLVSEGLLDKESFTQTDDQATQKFVSGKSFVINGNSQTVVLHRTDMNKSLGEGKFSIAKITVPGGPAGQLMSGSRLENGVMILAKAKENPNFKAILQFIDWLYYSDEGEEFAKWGVEGVTYTKENGVRKLVDDINYNGLNPKGTKDLRIDYGFSGGVFAYGGTTELLQSMFSDEEKKFQEDMKKTKTVVPAEPPIPYSVEDREQATLLSTPLKDYSDQNTLKFILGERPLSQFDAFVNELKGQGVNGLRVTAQEVVTYLTEPAGDLESRIDRIIAGSPEAEVRGIGVAFIASHDIVLEASRLGVNLLVTHEGAFYSHQEEQGFAPEDPDHPHSYRPDIITAGLIEALGWQDYEHRDLGTASVVRLPQSRRLSDIAGHVKQKLNLPYLRAVGDPETVCGQIGVAVGYRGGGQHAIPLFEQERLDLMIIGEGPEWETPEYVRDASAQGRAKALLMLGHAASEEPGMKLISERLAGRFPGLPVHFIPSGSMVEILILHLELEPGTKISEKEIADELNVSRTPVREAFMKLAEEELLDIIPQSGTIVSRINLKHVEEGRFIREKLEKEIVALACDQLDKDARFKIEANIAMQDVCAGQNNFYRLFELDEEYHQILFDATGKQRTWKMLQQLNIHFNRLRLLRLSKDSNWENIIRQHKEIYQLIIQQDKEHAMKVMEQHLRLVVVEQDFLKEKYPHYFI
ncbi:hypothetical protein BGX30_006193, partial [Mortierella sp. GBA39]